MKINWKSKYHAILSKPVRIFYPRKPRYNKASFFRRPFIMTCFAWNTTPSLATLCRAIEQHTAPLYLIVCLPENRIPDFPLSNQPSELEGRLNNRLVQAMKCLQFNSVNVLENLLPNVHLWLVPPHRVDRLHEHFHHIEWQTEAIPQVRPSPLKPWFRRPLAIR